MGFAVLEKAGMIDDGPLAVQPGSVEKKAASENMEPIDAETLFQGRKEIQLKHSGEIYRLRITGNGKLILNK